MAKESKKKKGLIILLTIAMIFSIVACSYDAPIIEVKSIELNKKTVSVSSEFMNDVKLEVKEILPVDAADKQVTFALENPEMVIAGEATETTEDDVLLKDFATVSSNGLVTFTAVNGIEDIHKKFNVVAKSTNGVTAKCEFYLNYAAPATLENVTYNEKAVVGKETIEEVEYTTIDLIDNGTVYNFVKFDFNLAENEYPGVTLTSSNPNIVTVDETDPLKIVAVSEKSGFVQIVATADEGTATKTFNVYVNRITSVDELKAFMVDTTVTTTSNRIEQLKAADEGYLTKSLEEVPGIVSKATNGKRLTLNGYNITFKTDDSNTAFNLVDATGNFAIIAKIGETTEKVTMANTTMDATFAITGAKNKIGLVRGTYEVDGRNYNPEETAQVAGANVVAIKGNADITNATINVYGGMNKSAVVVESEGNIGCTCTGLTVNVSALYGDITVFEVNAKTTLENVNVKVTANADEVIAVKADADTVIKGGSYVIGGIFGSVYPVKKATAIKQGNCNVLVVGTETESEEGTVVTPVSFEVNAEKVVAVDTKITTDTNKLSIKSAVIKANAKEEAVALHNAKGTVEIKDTTVEAKSVAAFGLYNLDKMTVDNVLVTVNGNKIENDPIFLVTPEYPTAVAGIITQGEFKAIGDLTVTVYNTGNKDTRDVYGIYNAKKLSFVSDGTDKPSASINVNVDNGGATALKNKYRVEFIAYDAEFEASRTNEVNVQEMVYGLDNVDDSSNGLILDGSTVSFTAKSYNTTSGKNIGNVYGYVNKQATYGFGTLTFEPSAN